MSSALNALTVNVLCVESCCKNQQGSIAKFLIISDMAAAAFCAFACQILGSDAFKQASLPCVPFFQTLFKHPQQFCIPDKPPRSLIYKSWRNFSYEAFDEQVRAQSFQHVDEKVEIFVKAETFEVFGSVSIFMFHLRAFDNLQLVELD